MLRSLLVITLLVIISALSFMGNAFAQWVAPTLPPPGGNTPPPINVGATTQSKPANLGVMRLNFGVPGGPFLRGDTALPTPLEPELGSALDWASGQSTFSQIVVRDRELTQYGTMYGAGDGSNFGLLDGLRQWIFRSRLNQEIQLRVNNSTIMTLLNGGNVGIGTGAPGFKLDVAGTIRAGNSANPTWGNIITDSINSNRVYSYDAMCVGNAFGNCAGSGGTVIGLANPSATTNITSGTSFFGGNVGIGTVSPRGVFDITTDGDIYLANNPIAGTAQSVFLPGHIYIAPYNGTNISYLQTRRSDNSGSTELQLRTYNAGTLTEAVRINGVGNVGIGNSAPGERLDVTGNIKASGTVCNGSGQCIGPAAAGLYLPLAGGTMNPGSTITFNGDANYGVGVGSAIPNKNSIAVDTVETDPGGTLELNYYSGGEVHVGPGGGKALRASILYDGNDPSYYVDPNSASNLNRITNRMKAMIGSSALYNNPRPDITGDTHYWTGSMGWGTTDLNNVYSDWGSGFFDTWGSPGNAPGGSSHYVGLQGSHFGFGDGTNAYGFQMAMAGGANNRFFWRSGWPSPLPWVEMLHSGNISGFETDPTVPAWAKAATPPSGADNLGNHTAMQNILLGSNWLSGDGGNEGIRIDTAGSVGIGMASPSNKLHVLGAIGATDWIGAGCESNCESAGGYSILYPNGVGHFTTQVNAPQFIDWDNASYYLDPQGSSRLYNTTNNAYSFAGVGADSGNPPAYYGIYQESGPWASPYPDLRIQYHTGIKYDAYAGYGGHRFYTGYDGSGNPAGLTFSVGDGDANTRVYGDLYVGTLGGMVSSVLCRSNGTNCLAPAETDPTVPAWAKAATPPSGADNLGNHTAIQALNMAGNDIVSTREIYNDGWFRNNAAGVGLYNQTTGNHIYSINNNYWTAQSANGMVFRNGYEGATRGYLYHDASGNFGLLSPDGNWRVQTYVGGQTLHGNTTQNGELYVNSWVRPRGDAGLYFEDHGGGWHMTDPTWIRAYNNKSVYSSGEIQATTIRGNTNVCIGADCRNAWPAAAAETDPTVPAWAKAPTPPSGADNLGNHTAIQNILLGSNWISNDGDNEGVRVDAAGNVGIGTPSSGAKLEVAGQIKVTGGAPGAGKVLTSDAVGLASWTTPAGGGNDNLGNHTATQNILLGSSWLSGDGGNEGVRVDAAGNVGIGVTPSAGAKFEVAGQIKVTGGAPGAGKILTSDAVGLASWTTPAGGGVGGSGTTNNVPKWTAGTTLGNSQIFDNGTSVGINNNSPSASYRLDVNGTISATNVRESGTGKLLSQAITTTCASGQFLQSTGAAWTCVNSTFIGGWVAVDPFNVTSPTIQISNMGLTPTSHPVTGHYYNYGGFTAVTPPIFCGGRWGSGSCGSTLVSVYAVP